MAAPVHQLLWIDGREVAGTSRTQVLNPFDGSLVGEVEVAGEREVELAIDATARAFDTTRRMPTHARVSVLERTSRLLLEHVDELAVLIAREAGKPLRFARGEVQRASVTFALAAAECRAPEGEVLPIDLEPRAEGRLCLTRRVPRGPVAAIAPFNFPLNLIAHKLAPSIAVGASVVLKPPPQCPLTGFRLAALLHEAGLPAGALNVVHCAPEHAQKMVEHDAIKVLSFTGSDTVGWKLKSLAGKKQVLLELGGNAPCVIDEDVEFERALDKLVLGAWAYAGQVCIKIQRLFVHESLFERFLEAFVERTRALKVGDPLDPETVVGPLIEPVHVERVKSWVDEAVAAGAKLHCGGTVEGQVLQPAVLTEVAADMKVCREEVFGPVTVLQPFASFDEALELCNATRFGLQAGVFTRDVNRAMRAFRELDYGGVMINEIPTFRVDNFPYGGTKDSGFGREGVRYAMAEMSEPRVLVVGEL